MIQGLKAIDVHTYYAVAEMQCGGNARICESCPARVFVDEIAAEVHARGGDPAPRRVASDPHGPIWLENHLPKGIRECPVKVPTAHLVKVPAAARPVAARSGTTSTACASCWY